MVQTASEALSRFARSEPETRDQAGRTAALQSDIVAAETDDVVEIQHFGEQPVEFLIAEAAVSDASAAGCQGVCRMLSLITDHGRATPLVWLTVDKSTLKNHRSLLMVAWLSAVE